MQRMVQEGHYSAFAAEIETLFSPIAQGLWQASSWREFIIKW